MTSENLVTVAEGTSLEQAEVVLQGHKIEKLPVINDKNELVGLITFRDITKLTQKPNANKDRFGRLRVAAALGVTADAVERATALVNAGVDAVSRTFDVISFRRSLKSHHRFFAYNANSHK